jgi:hypothetical protein
MEVTCLNCKKAGAVYQYGSIAFCRNCLREVTGYSDRDICEYTWAHDPNETCKECVG